LSFLLDFFSGLFALFLLLLYTHCATVASVFYGIFIDFLEFLYGYVTIVVYCTLCMLFYAVRVLAFSTLARRLLTHTILRARVVLAVALFAPCAIVAPCAPFLARLRGCAVCFIGGVCCVVFTGILRRRFVLSYICTAFFKGGGIPWNDSGAVLYTHLIL
jgi:hypothetical protein